MLSLSQIINIIIFKNKDKKNNTSIKIFILNKRKYDNDNDKKIQLFRFNANINFYVQFQSSSYVIITYIRGEFEPKYRRFLLQLWIKTSTTSVYITHWFFPLCPCNVKKIQWEKLEHPVYMYAGNSKLGS